MNDKHDRRQKRRRLQDAPPTAEAIAQSNATLQLMTGRNMGQACNGNNTGGGGRRNHAQPQVQSVTSPGGETATMPRPAVTTSQSTTSSATAVPSPMPSTRAGMRHPSATSSHPLSHLGQTMSQQTPRYLTQQFQPIVSQANASAQTWNAVNGYPNPDITDGARAMKRASTDVRPHMLARGGLPSPALSDGNNQSPVTHVGNRRPGPGTASFTMSLSQSTSPVRHSQGTGAATPVPRPAALSPSLPSAGSGSPAALNDTRPAPALLSNLSTLRSGSYGNALALQVPSPTQHSPTQTYLRDTATVSDLRAPQQGHMSAGVNIPNMSRSQPAGVQVPTKIPPFRGHINDFMKAINQQQLHFPAANAAKSLESGRLLLLYDALKTGDVICLVLHQLFCTASVRPDALLPPFNQLDPTRFRSMDTLLGFNRDADPRFLAFCATFPEPLGHVYAGFSPLIHGNDPIIRAVAEFLNKFPTNWDYLRGVSERLGTTPLVQDIVDQLGVQSLVLQTTAFRSVVRLLRGITDVRSLCHLEDLHRLDQALYHKHQYRRTPAENTQLHYLVAAFIDRIRQWELGLREAPLLVPRALIDSFKQPPRSVPQVQPHGQPPRSDLNPTQLSPAQQHPNQPYLTSLPPMASSMPQASLTNSAMNPGSFGGPPPYRSRPSKPVRLFPTPQETPRPQPTHPEPLRSALHQAHLRSPVLMAEKTEDGSGKLYRYVIGFSLPPTKLDMSCPSQVVSFLIPDLAVELRPKNPNSDLEKGKPSQLTVAESTRTFRLRCCYLPPTGFPSEADWVLADCVWPEEMYLEFNGNILEKRRKLQHGKHLPVELTDFAKGQKDGQNILKVFLNRDKKAPPKHEYIIAVELIGFASHKTILGAPRWLSAEDSVNSIRKSLAGTSTGPDNEDDEIAVTSSSLAIKLFDPYSASKIFDLPVRGVSCLHRDCFDLETFLAMCKRPSGQNQPTVVDCWRCPLCRGDVRPQTLVVDGFLVEVRRELARQNRLDTRAIVVQSDGSWSAQLEERNGTRSQSVEHRQNTPALASAANQQTAPIEIIELD